MGNKDMENKTEDILHKPQSRKYLTIAIVLAALFIIGAIIGIKVYYRISDVNGYSKMEIKQAENVVLRYVSYLEQGDGAGVEECLVEDGEAARSLEYDLQWSHFIVHDLRYEPDSTLYSQMKRWMKEEPVEPQNWILLTMDCDWVVRYETHKVPIGWILVREDERKPWKILRYFK